MAAIYSRPNDLDIPERPTALSRPERGFGLTRRMLLYGGVPVLILIVVVVAAMLWQRGGEEVARSPAEAPLIKAEEQPFKVLPENPGGAEAPNRDMLVYRLQNTGGKPPVERLLPEPEQPMAPPHPQPDASSAPAPGLAPQMVEPPVLGGTADEAPGSALPAPAVPQKSPADKPAKVAALPKAPVPAAPPSAKSADKSVVPARGRFQVQLFSGRSTEDVNGAWAKLKGRNADLLASLAPTVARAELGDRGTFYRLRAGPLADEAKARALCSALAGRNVSCIVIRPKA
jgi:sporulation related protein